MNFRKIFFFNFKAKLYLIICCRHDACINRLRLRYIEFLEEQRDRDDRNNKLRGALDKVDNHLALMNAKSNRLNALRVSFIT